MIPLHLEQKSKELLKIIVRRAGNESSETIWRERLTERGTPEVSVGFCQEAINLREE